MEEDKDLKVEAESGAGRESSSEMRRSGPSWRAWAVSIVAAIVLSVAATLLLGGSGAFRPGRASAAGAIGSGCGGGCCPPAVTGK